MRLKFDKPKGQRIKRGFYSVEIEEVDWWWEEDSRTWKRIADAIPPFVSNSPCKTVKAFRRHVRKHKKYMGQVTFRLVSAYVGYDVYA